MIVADPVRLRPAGFAGHHASTFGLCAAAPRVARRAKRGGARRDRTADLVIANDALSQLSYGPVATAPEGGRQSGPFTFRAHAKSRTVKSRFSVLFCRELPLFAGA